MGVLLYNVFSVSLFLWMTQTIRYESAIPAILYLAGFALTGIWFITRYVRKKRRLLPGELLVALLINIGMSVNYRCARISENIKELVNSAYVWDLVLMLAAFEFVYLIVRFTEIYRSKWCNLLIAIILPVFVFGARMSGIRTGGSYLYFAGFLIFGSVLTGYPFISAWFMSAKEDRYWNGKVGNVSWNLLGFMLYTFVLYIGFSLCNEFGAILIIGLTSSVLYFIRCKDIKSKIFYITACAGGALLSVMEVPHVRNRVQIWLDPVSAYTNDNLKEQAESVLYVFRHFNSMGWWGRMGSLSKSIYPTWNTDHVLVLLMNDYGIIFLGLILVLGILLIRWMFITPKKLCTYDYYLNLSCALIFAFNILLNVASNLGSFITAGISYPLLSEGASISIMAMIYTAVHCGLLIKGGMQDA